MYQQIENLVNKTDKGKRKKKRKGESVRQVHGLFGSGVIPASRCAFSIGSLLRCSRRASITIIVFGHSLALRRTGIGVGHDRAKDASPPPTSLHGRCGHVGAFGDVRVDGGTIHNGRVECGDVVCQLSEIGRVAFEVVCSLAGDANLVLAAKLETLCLLSYLSEEPETLLLGSSALLYHGSEILDLGGNGEDGGGEDGIEFTEVSKVAREVDGEGVEGVCVLCEEGEGVGGVEEGLGGHDRWRGFRGRHNQRFKFKCPSAQKTIHFRRSHVCSK